MRFHILYVFLAVAGIAAAFPAPEDLLRGGVVLREDIPEGVEVKEFDETNLAPIQVQAEGTSANPLSVDGLGLAKRSDCNGSGGCGGMGSEDCKLATLGFQDNTAYCGYTSRVAEHCTAIFTCNDFRGRCMYGWWLKEQFRKIYSVVQCGTCGSYTIPDGDVFGCRATYNYCLKCNNVG